jgi:glycosylphosphatidylinositol phospholipase D
LIFGTGQADMNGRRDSGSAYVVFGRSHRGRIDLGPLGPDEGFRIDGPPPALPIEFEDSGPIGEGVGTSVAGLGDVNGDGLGDVALGAPFSSASLRALAGAVYVVFGKASTEPVDLAALGEAGYRIDGNRVFDLAGITLSGTGEANGDGRHDVLLGGTRSGAYVVYGKPGSEAVDLRHLAGKGYRISLSKIDDPEGESESGHDFYAPLGAAGDVNGDARGDSVIGMPEATFKGRPSAGAAFVVYGKSGDSTVRLRALGSDGFRIDGAEPESRTGQAVAGAGDVNGDGRADVVVGAPGLTFGGRPRFEEFDPPESGAAYVVFGGEENGRLDLAHLGDRGFRVRGARGNDHAGRSVAGIGDLNADSRSDLVVGAPGVDRGCRSGTGAAYVVYGQSRPSGMSLGGLGDRGYRLVGLRRLDFAGQYVAGPGDVTATVARTCW